MNTLSQYEEDNYSDQIIVPHNEKAMPLSIPQFTNNHTTTSIYTSKLISPNEYLSPSTLLFSPTLIAHNKSDDNYVHFWRRALSYHQCNIFY